MIAEDAVVNMDKNLDRIRVQVISNVSLQRRDLVYISQKRVQRLGIR